jgi:type IV secretory pathway VirB10-like protein
MRPTGPLPPRVYWTRRVVLVVAVAIVAGLVWFFVSGSGRADQAAADDAEQQAAPRDTTQTTPPGNASPTTNQTPQQQPQDKPERQHPTKPADKQKPKRAPLAQPTGDCKPQDVDMKIDVGDSAPGEPNTATLLLSSDKLAACTLSITPDTMTVRVTSGEDVVWSSDNCPDALRAQQVVAREELPAAYQFRWSGQRSSDNCQPVSALPSPGGYWVEAAMIGGEPHRAYFDIKAAKHA